jgi:signal transduction histidine kinase
MLKKLSQSIYWKLSAIFLLLMTLVGAAYIYLTLFQTEMYFAETSQKINAMLAEHIVNDIQPFVDGKPNLAAMEEIFHDVMVVNPSVEVYLLDEKGTILSFNAPREKVKISGVSLGPINEFISSGGKEFVLGDNPRNMSKPKVFSAAEVTMNNMVYGYIYVILGGEEYDSAAQRIADSHFLTLALRALLLSLIGASVIGLVGLAFVTRKLRRMTRTVNAFKDGDYSQRVVVRTNDELDQLACAYNEMADTIKNNLEELTRADELRRELIANVSHDLRTPLASVQGYIETVLMKNETLSADERREYLRTILGGTERLNKLVLELFELSKLEAKQTRPKPEPFSMPELVNDLAQKFAPQAEQKGIAISTDSPKGLPLVKADIGLIERVLQNLFENAITYTPSGGKVKVVLEQREGKVKTEVEDTGIGISNYDLPFIFNRFYQVRTNKKATGSGLGLAIVKKILEAHGEVIGAESRVNEGTKFVFELPVVVHS